MRRMGMVSWCLRLRGPFSLNWSWILLRSAIGVGILTLLFLSQRFWYRALWRVTSNWGRVWLRVGLRLAYISGWVLFIVAATDVFRQDHGRILAHRSNIEAFAGLWFASALAAYGAVKAVHGLEWL